MLTNEHLQEELARSYPSEYNPDSWTQLLPRYISDRIGQHYQAVADYQQHADNWQQQDPAVAVPDAPLPPDRLMYACQVYAKQSGFRFDTLAFSLLAAERKALDYKRIYEFARKEADHYRQLWEESEEGKEAMRMSEQSNSVEER